MTPTTNWMIPASLVHFAVSEHTPSSKPSNSYSSAAVMAASLIRSPFSPGEGARPDFGT